MGKTGKDIRPYDMILLLIAGLSLLLQVISAYVALRLIAVTRWKKAWLLLSTGIITMAMRRAITFVAILRGAPMTHPQEMGFETIGLIGSLMMLVGIFLIKPLFLSLTAAEQEQRELAGKLQDALSKIKVLRGLLPICAHCKRIRDDKGYWGQLEVYIRDHSDAEFSHGICPDCAQKYYPDYYEKTSGTKDPAKR